jgi:hypothetical protein
MYSDRELIRLGVHKRFIRRAIALRRLECTEAAAQVAQPLEWLDRVVSFWRRVSPFAKFASVPIGLIAQRTPLGRSKVLSTLLRWGPVAYNVVCGLTSARRR